MTQFSHHTVGTVHLKLSSHVRVRVRARVRVRVRARVRILGGKSKVDGEATEAWCN